MVNNKGGKSGSQKTAGRVGKEEENPPQKHPPKRPATSLVTAGRDPRAFHGFVNPPVVHASTVLYPSAEEFLAHRARYQYASWCTLTTIALEHMVVALERPLT